MDFSISALTHSVRHRFAHLRIRQADPDGIVTRVLDIRTCGACQRLWERLTPVHGHRRSLVERWSPLTMERYLRGDVAGSGGTRAAGPRPARDEGPAAVQRIVDDAPGRGRSRRLERY